MAETVTLLTVPQTIAAAEALRVRADASLSLARAFVGVPDVTIASMAVLIDQLDRMARLAADLTADPAHSEILRDLRGALSDAGYLPLPATTASEEATHGQG